MSTNDPEPPDRQPYGYDPYSGQPYPPPQEYGGAYPPPMPPAPYGYGYPSPQSERLRTQAIGVLVTNIVTVLLCCSPLGIAGIVVGAMAMGRADTQPESARSLVRWGWGLAIAWVALLVIGVVVLIAIGVATDPDLN